MFVALEGGSSGGKGAGGVLRSDATQPAGVGERVADYLRSHHTMSLATVDGGGNGPHAANVFYAVDDRLRLVFLSKRTSLHGSHIGSAARVAVTVSEDYGDWEMIQGVQLWGTARLLKGRAKAAALVLYIKSFPFVRDLLADSRHAEIVRDLGVYRVEPARIAFTDNRTGVFGREVLELEVE
jgi:uncharacterized protein YhbP (UPF0306 family)